MVWIKRLAPVVIVVLIVGIYFIARIKNEQKQDIYIDQYARITANIWVAKTKFRNDSEAFVKFRDSMLAVEKVTDDEIKEYIQIFQNKPENFVNFTRLVNVYVDSLSRIEIVPDTLSDTAIETTVNTNIQN